MKSPERRIIYEAKPIDPKEEVFFGELEKTGEDEQDIKLAADLLNGYMKKNGVHDRRDFSLEKIHLFPEGEFKRISEKKHPIGDYDPLTSNIRAVKNTDRLVTLFTILHEMVHGIGIRKWSFHPAKKGKDSLYRMGYATTDSQGSDDRTLHFHAFDEGVAEMIALATLLHGEDRVVESLNIPSENYEQNVRRNMAHEEAVSVVSSIIQGLAAQLREKETEIMRKTIQGKVNGNMLWMRDIENVFGEGSLRVLDKLIADPELSEEIALNKQIVKYFKTKDHEERMQMQYEIY